jgi:hypothetical protein
MWEYATQYIKTFWKNYFAKEDELSPTAKTKGPI